MLDGLVVQRVYPQDPLPREAEGGIGITVNCGVQDNATTFLWIRRQVGAAAAEADTQRSAAANNHPGTLSMNTLCGLGAGTWPSEQRYGATSGAARASGSRAISASRRSAAALRPRASRTRSRTLIPWDQG